MNPHAQMKALEDQGKLLESQVEEAQRNLETMQSELIEIHSKWLSIRNTLVLEKFRAVSDDFIEAPTHEDKRQWQHKTLPRLTFRESGNWSCYLVESPQKYMYGFFVLELAIKAAKTESVKSFEEYYRVNCELSSDGVVEFKDLPQSESCHV